MIHTEVLETLKQCQQRCEEIISFITNSNKYSLTTY